MIESYKYSPHTIRRRKRVGDYWKAFRMFVKYGPDGQPRVNHKGVISVSASYYLDSPEGKQALRQMTTLFKRTR